MTTQLDWSLVVPLIRVLAAEDTGRVIEVADEDWPVTRPFCADLIVNYAVDLPSHFEFINAWQLAEHGMTEDELHRLAMGNLPKRLPSIELHGEAPKFMVTAGGNFEATLLLVDDLWEQLEEQMAGGVLATVPARDLLFVSASGWEDGLPFLRDMASKDWESRYALSQCVLARREGKWVPYDSN